MKTNKEDIRNKVVDNLDMSREAENSEIHEIIDEIIAEETEYRYMSVSEKIGLHKYIFNSIKGLGILDELLEEINDIEKHSISDAEYKQKRKKNNSQGIVVKGLDNILIRFAKCCNPLPGDEIIGYVTKGRGVAIHRADCPNANVNGDFFKNRLVDVAWSNSEASKFEAEIQIKAVDRRGIINDITHIIAMDKVSLNGISAKKGKDNVVSVNLLVEVNNIDALNTLMKKIKSIPGVENIYRVIN